MAFNVIWSEFAETQLDGIFEYYKHEANTRVAKKLLKELINEANKLSKSPNIGQIEELLNKRVIQYRYLVYKNYKLIYSIDTKSANIKIADIFDTRQNPTKIERTK
jgi:toxin ParE1/3/4